MLNSEALNRAADRIESHGWYSRAGGGLGDCASNSIQRVAGVGHPAQRALVAYLGGIHLSSIWDWNDAPERTQAEVVEVLRACALVEAARENTVARQSVPA
jgi:hypothetical protein